VPFARAYSALVEHPRLAELWPEYLILQHQIIRATVPLTQAALARARELDDPLAEPLARYLEEHVDEELGHDETLLGDLELLGIDRKTVLTRMPPPAVAGLVGSQYYWIHHYHPVAFLGYVALMEGYPPTRELIDELVERSGHPRAAFRTYIEHAELDPGHRDHLDRTIDSLPLDASHEVALGISAIATAALAASSLEELLPER
jgi:Iron-containing redox enzyme